MASSQPILLSRNVYDPLDRLISQFGPGATAHQRFYCKSRLRTEIQGAIGYSIFQQDDLLLAQQKNQNDAVESTLLATDLQRSVLRALQADLQPPFAYSPYGYHSAESGLSSLLGFNGERADPVTKCYPLGNGYRMFNPVLMRFNSPDSWSPFGEGGLNAYMYCLGDPINNIDSAGHMPFRFLLSEPAVHRPLLQQASIASGVGAIPTPTPLPKTPTTNATRAIPSNSTELKTIPPQTSGTVKPPEVTQSLISKIAAQPSTSQPNNANPVNYIGHDQRASGDALNRNSAPTLVIPAPRKTMSSRWDRIDKEPIKFPDTRRPKAKTPNETNTGIRTDFTGWGDQDPREY
ncbi:RHS repeat-associated core domain-containing protein [Pseudomonas sp. MAG733B]|uniref:RHS repeat-associated core domain-containing protein n=1 Tax=Pseudomonas sp. MAG733B TaxID=3122079 RepID=UPI0030CAEEF6